MIYLSEVYSSSSEEGVSENVDAPLYTPLRVTWYTLSLLLSFLFFYFLFFSSHTLSSPYITSPSSSRSYLKIRGHVAGTSPPPTLIRCAPSFLSHLEFSIFLPRRLASNRFTHAAKRYLLVRFCARTSPLTRFSLTQSILVVTRLNHYHRRDRLGGTKD